MGKVIKNSIVGELRATVVMGGFFYFPLVVVSVH